MPKSFKEIFKFLFGLCLAVFISGAIYNYFPNFADAIKETGFFMASLVSGTEQKTDSQQQQINQPEQINKKVQPEIAVEKTALEVNLVDEPRISQQDKLDEISDQIDIIQREINDLLIAQNPPQKEAFAKDEKFIDQINEQKVKEDSQVTEDNQIIHVAVSNYSGGSGARNEYPKILISEVEASGATDDKQEFVELYNPNNIDIDLTSWYLQRKTKTATDFSTYASSNLFLGKKIVAKNYFLIAREGVYFPVAPDIVTDSALTEDNSLILKNPNREASDLIGWGQASHFEGNLADSPPNGLSIGRKWADNSEQDTDNNFVDFEIQNLTPKAQNLRYIQPANPPSPDGSDGSSAMASKILISEILLGENEFIELYNPNNIDIDLTNWYLQRKTKTAQLYSSYLTKTDFSGKKILADDYFLIARQGSQYQALADIIFDEPLTEDNSLVLKDFNGNISDKLGFGLASDFELLASVTPSDGKSLARKWVENLEQDTDNNFVDFEIKTPTPKAKNIEPELVVEPPPPIENPPEEKKDATPPSIIFNLPETQTSLSFPINFEIADIMETTSSGVASYVFRWKEGNNDWPASNASGVAGAGWQEDPPEIVDGSPEKFNGSRDFVGEDQKTYYFQIKATDSFGNESLWLPEIPVQTKIEIPPQVAAPKPVVINEIQTDGKTTKDEFIELYNPNDFDIDLSGFVLKKKTSGGTESNLVSSEKFSGTILAKNYFLIAPPDNIDGSKNYTGTVTPDLRYSGSSYSVAFNNTVLLYDKAGVLQDKVGFGTAKDFETSPALNPPANKSISRIKGVDSDDNNKDFIILDFPTPKAE